MYKVTKSNWACLTGRQAKTALFLLAALAVMFGTKESVNQTQAISQTPFEVKQTASNTPALVETVASKAAVVSGPALEIDALGINIPLGRTGLDAGGHLAVPANPDHAAWYTLGPKPGNSGTALITGHLDSAAGPGVFYHLRNLSAGDVIKVARDDGRVATFKVQKLASYAQDATFPWNLVYSPSGPAALCIITCDGVYSRSLGHYTRNLVVYANLVSLD